MMLTCAEAKGEKKIIIKENPFKSTKAWMFMYVLLITLNAML